MVQKAVQAIARDCKMNQSIEAELCSCGGSRGRATVRSESIRSFQYDRISSNFAPRLGNLRKIRSKPTTKKKKKGCAMGEPKIPKF